MSTVSRLYGQVSSILSRPVPAELIRAYRFYFSFHIALHSLKLQWGSPDAWWLHPLQAVLAAAALLTLHRRFYFVGLLPLAAYKLFWVVTDFPNTANHSYAEFLIVLLLLLFPDQEVEREKQGEWVEGSCVGLVQFAILSIYFFAGVHKIVHGFWLSGEFMLQTLFKPFDTGLWESTKAMFRFLEPLSGFDPGALAMQPMGFEAWHYSLPGWAGLLLLLLSWLTVASEFGIPVLVAMPRTHRLGVWLMLPLQIGIGIAAWETEFMFGAVGAILLFFHSNIWRNFLILLGCHIAWSAFVILADIQIWIL